METVEKSHAFWLHFQSSFSIVLCEKIWPEEKWKVGKYRDQEAMWDVSYHFFYEKYVQSEENVVCLWERLDADNRKRVYQWYEDYLEKIRQKKRKQAQDWNREIELAKRNRFALE